MMMRMMARALGVALVSLVPAGCGLPTGGVTAVDDSSIPYNLLSEPAASATSTPEGPLRSHPAIYWVDGDNLVATVSARNCRPAGVQLVEALLDELLPGPSDEARARGLTSAIAPGTELAVEELVAGTAVIDLQTPNQISADLLPLALGQLVLTLTSAPDVDAVILTNDGERVEIPVPGGALTAEAVTADDYVSMVRPQRGMKGTPEAAPCA